jgi:hypothetical protein
VAAQGLPHLWVRTQISSGSAWEGRWEELWSWGGGGGGGDREVG